jgi:hypothetical protein
MDGGSILKMRKHERKKEKKSCHAISMNLNPIFTTKNMILIYAIGVKL